MENAASTFAVLLAQPEARDPMALAKALAGIRKTPLQDQVVLAKNCWGFVAESLAEPEARSLTESLRQAGVETLVFSTASVVRLPEAEAAAKIPALAPNPVLITAAAI